MGNLELTARSSSNLDGECQPRIACKRRTDVLDKSLRKTLQRRMCKIPSTHSISRSEHTVNSPELIAPPHLLDGPVNLNADHPIATNASGVLEVHDAPVNTLVDRLRVDGVVLLGDLVHLAVVEAVVVGGIWQGSRRRTADL